jgi:Rho GTPase-activating protein 19
MQSDSKRLQTMQLLVQLLPVEHATLLRHLLGLLHCVTLEPANRMTADNLAILFVPHIIVPRKVN